jgi:hypothetical protein
MRRSVRAAFCVTTFAVAGAVLCYVRASSLRGEGDWLMARANAQAEEYANTFDGQYADQQLATYNERQDVLLRASTWHRFEMLFIMLAVLSAVSTYLLHLLSKIQTELKEVTEEAAGDPS